MTDQNAIRLGIVGCGGISHRHAQAAHNIADKAKFVACCDINEEKAQAWAAQYGADAVYTDYEKMIRAEDLDGVLLATWPNQHREQIEKCLAAGARNILCEKALALTGQEAIEIWELVGAAGAFVMEGFMYRHYPAIAKLDSILATGELGPVDNVRAVFSYYDSEEAPAMDTTRNWRQRKECGGGIAYDFACYCINACGHFAGDIPVRVFGSGSISEKYQTINRLYGMIEYGNGCVGIIESSKKSDFSQELQITCSYGVLNLPLTWTPPEDITIELRHSKRWGVVLTDTYVIPATNFYQQPQLENFANVIRGEAQPLMPLVESVVNTFTLEGMVNSMLEKRVIDVQLPESVQRALAQSEGAVQ